MTKQNKNTQKIFPAFIDDSLMRTHKIFLYIVLMKKVGKKSKDLKTYDIKNINISFNKQTKEIEKLEKIFAMTYHLETAILT